MIDLADVIARSWVLAKALAFFGAQTGDAEVAVGRRRDVVLVDVALDIVEPEAGYGLVLGRRTKDDQVVAVLRTVSAERAVHDFGQ